MSYRYHRTICFRDTDAAGVVYFANVLALCHEAYEMSLSAAGISPKAFFAPAELAFPIAHASVDFFYPLFCGDRVEICCTPRQTSDSDFEIVYDVLLESRDRPVSRARTRHVCIDTATRTRKDLPVSITQWLQQWSEPETPEPG